jgi:hypothetical protein
MTDPHEQTPSSPSPSPWHNDPLALVSELVRLRRSTVESLVQDITVPQQVLLIAPTPEPRYAPVRCMLKLTWSLTLPDTASLSRMQRYMQLTPPAIRALAYSSMQEFLPSCSFVGIEMTPAFGYWQT